jgi:hypothetical protein
MPPRTTITGKRPAAAKHASERKRMRDDGLRLRVAQAAGVLRELVATLQADKAVMDEDDDARRAGVARRRHLGRRRV